MKWRILASVAALVPAVLVALRDGKLEPHELDQLADRLEGLLVALLAKP